MSSSAGSPTGDPGVKGSTGGPTLYRIFEAATSYLAVFEHVGAIEADNAEHALRLFYKEPPEVERIAVAVASSRWQPRPIKAREPRTSLGAPLEMPAVIPGQVSMLESPEAS